MKYSEKFTSATATHVNFDIYLPTVMIAIRLLSRFIMQWESIQGAMNGLLNI